MELLAQSWWAVAIRGVVAILFGLAAFFWPGPTLFVLVALFGAYVLVDGVFALVASIRAMQQQSRWWPLLLHGILGIGAGIITFFYPHITAVALLVIIAVWAILIGISSLVGAVELRRHIRGEWMLGLSGIVSILFGIVLIVQPLVGALTLVWLIGVYAVIFGILEIGVAFRLRGVQQALRTQAQT